MRVLFYSSIFPRPWNPARGIYCFHVCRALEQMGHEVRVVSPRSFLERAGAPAPLPGLSELKVDYPVYVYPPRVLQSAHDRFMEFSSWRTMRRVMSTFRPDCVLSYWVHPDGEVAARFAHRADVPAGVIVGGSDVLVVTSDPRRRRSVVRALHTIDAIAPVGRHLADAVEALGIPASKVHVVHQGVDEIFSPGPAAAARERLGLPVSGKVLVSVGNLLPIKGLDVLLEATSRLVRRRDDVTLCLVGDGASRSELESLATRLGLASVVRFVGRIAPSNLPDWYRAADLSVLASRSEGVPNVLRESLACGTPFVATRVGGVAEIAEGTPCRLVPPEDAGALCDALAVSLEEPRPALSRASFLTWKQSTQKLLDVTLSKKRG